MPSYYIMWPIDIEADSPEEAAKQAVSIMLNPSYDSTYVIVREETGFEHEIEVSLP